MSAKIKRQRLLINLGIITLLTTSTLIVIQFAKGYRPNLKQKKINGTGLLAISSYPKQGQVMINDRLTTTTDDTLYLPPQNYQVKILKDGFLPWQKEVPVKTELVSLATARLFPTLPTTTPLTFYHVQNTTLSPDGTKIAFVLTDSPFKTDNGLYTISLNTSLIGGNQIIQLTDLSQFDYTQATLLWSPNSNQILASFINADHTLITSSHLLETKDFNAPRSITDTTIRLPLILSQWQEQLAKLDQPVFNQLPKFMQELLSVSAINVYFSPDQEKVFYTTTADISLPQNEIGQKLPNINPTPEERNLKANQTYVYDSKEGTNYHLSQSVNQENIQKTLLVSTKLDTTSNEATKSADEKEGRFAPLSTNPLVLITQLKAQTDSGSTTNLRWYSDSSHLIITSQDKVQIIEYDGLNLTPLIEANISENFSTPSVNGNQLIILTNLHQKENQQNLFSLDLK